MWLTRWIDVLAGHGRRPGVVSTAADPGERPDEQSASPAGVRDRVWRLRELRAARTRRKQGERHHSRGFLLALAGVPVVAGGITALLLGLLLLQGATAAYAALTENLPPISKIKNYAPFKTAQIFDRHGQLLWEFYDPDGGKRTVVPLNQISQHLIDATLAAEDANYYAHPGFDLRATVRSAVLDALGGPRTGASTITQQLVRNVLLSPQEARQVTISRKLREILLAYRLNQQYSKDQILAMYLNEVYYGEQSYGAEAASETYFGKHARDLSIAEAALLAGLVQSPSYYDPLRKDVPRTADGLPVQTKERQRYVLEQMAYDGFITRQEARDAYAEKLVFKPHQVKLQAPHWVMYIRDLVEQKYGARAVYQGGLKIYTTLDLGYDELMNKVLQDAKANIQAHGGNNAALIAVNPKTGEILAFQGSMDYNDASIDGQVNVLLSERQPGSSIKPVVYSEAFSRGWAPGTPVLDAPACWEDRPGHQWCPKNFDNQFHGQTTARTALGNSLNIPAVKTLEFAGVDNVVALGQKMGITTWGPDSGQYFGLSLTLGGAAVRPYDLAQVYATLANNGLKIPLVAITRIVDAEGKVLEDYKVPQGEQVLDPRAAYMVTNILSDPAAKLFTYGRNTPLVLHQTDGELFPAASKTGTTDNYRDTWTAGYTPNLAIVVWVGNTDGHPMREVLSSMTAGKIWPEAMTASIDYLHLQPTPFPRPDGLVERPVCGDTYLRPGEPLCRQDLFFAERAPRRVTVASGVNPAAGAGSPQPSPAPSPTPTAASGARPAPTRAPPPTAQPTPGAQPAAAAPTPTPRPTQVSGRPPPTPTARPAPPPPAPRPTPPSPASGH